MKIRHDRKDVKCEKFIYFLCRVIIKSDIKLTKIQKKRIRNIIRKNTENPYYGFDYIITKEIFHLFDKNVSNVSFYYNSKKIFITINKKIDTGFK